MKSKLILLAIDILIPLILICANEKVFIDTHAHILARVMVGRGQVESDYNGAIKTLLSKMDEFNIKKTVIMPHPFIPGQSDIYELNDYAGELRKYPDKIIFFGGGGSLNVMIHRYADAKEITQKVKDQFGKKAADLLALGAKGFGEMAALHFSLQANHPFEYASPDHPLFLLLSDIAAENQVPIDLHMEAVSSGIKMPEKLRVRTNPENLKPNIEAFERLLDYNKNTIIIWDHLGWDNTGHRTVELCSRLLKDHKNLFMNIKFAFGRDGLQYNPIMDIEKRKINDDWLKFLNEFSDRLMLGSDQFYYSPKSNEDSPNRIRPINLFISLLPENIAKKILYENPVKIFSIL
jgi:predicted TIM-barrel fold metal-dependent hydrolase